MVTWLENFTFSDIVLGLTLLISSIAAYFNLDSKLNSVIEKVDEVEKSQENVAKDLKQTEAENKKDIMLIKAAHDARFTVIEERQRVTDVFIGRFDEKINYIVDQIRQLVVHSEKRSDK